jgi:hypothetical protein
MWTKKMNRGSPKTVFRIANHLQKRDTSAASKAVIRASIRRHISKSMQEHIPG